MAATKEKNAQNEKKTLGEKIRSKVSTSLYGEKNEINS
jgi:hypothetical protein